MEQGPSCLGSIPFPTLIPWKNLISSVVAAFIDLNIFFGLLITVIFYLILGLLITRISNSYIWTDFSQFITCRLRGGIFHTHFMDLMSELDSFACRQD